jgi:hypothetical protein
MGNSDHGGEIEWSVDLSRRRLAEVSMLEGSSRDRALGDTADITWSIPGIERIAESPGPCDHSPVGGISTRWKEMKPPAPVAWRRLFGGLHDKSTVQPTLRDERMQTLEGL